MKATKLKCVGIDEESSLLIFETPGGEILYSQSFKNIFDDDNPDAIPDKDGWVERRLIKSEVTFEIDGTKQ